MRQKVERDWLNISIDTFGILMVFTFVSMIGIALYSQLTTSMADRRYTLMYQGHMVKCRVQMPTQTSGKSSYWSGTVNLVDCDNSREYLGATNIEVIKKPKSNF